MEKLLQIFNKFGSKPAFGGYKTLLINWINAMSKRGFPITTHNLIVSVGKIVKDVDTVKLFNRNPREKMVKAVYET